MHLQYRDKAAAGVRMGLTQVAFTVVEWRESLLWLDRVVNETPAAAMKLNTHYWTQNLDWHTTRARHRHWSLAIL